VFSGPSFDDFDFDICCQGHDSELSSEDFSRCSLSVKKLLTKNVSWIK